MGGRESMFRFPGPTRNSSCSNATAFAPSRGDIPSETNVPTTTCR